MIPCSAKSAHKKGYLELQATVHDISDGGAPYGIAVDAKYVPSCNSSSLGVLAYTTHIQALSAIFACGPGCACVLGEL